MQSEDAIRGSERARIIDGLREHVAFDFEGVASLRGYRLIFRIDRLHSNATRAVVFARIMKRDARGRDFELTPEDYRGSQFERDIAEGLFDGPNVVAALAKTDDGWEVMDTLVFDVLVEAYDVGATDVPYLEWPALFCLPREWFPAAAGND